MKKVFNLFALVACFSFLAMTDVNAQYAVRNSTSCDFTIRATYSKSGNCAVEGVLSFSVPANTMYSFNVPDFPDNELFVVRGRSATGCEFTVGDDDCGLDPSDEGNCSPPPTTECNIYEVDWDVFGGSEVIWIHN